MGGTENLERANIWSTKEKEKYLMKENECCDGVGKVGKYLCLQGKKNILKSTGRRAT